MPLTKINSTRHRGSARGGGGRAARRPTKRSKASAAKDTNVEVVHYIMLHHRSLSAVCEQLLVVAQALLLWYSNLCAHASDVTAIAGNASWSCAPAAGCHQGRPRRARHSGGDGHESSYNTWYLVTDMIGFFCRASSRRALARMAFCGRQTCTPSEPSFKPGPSMCRSWTWRSCEHL